MIEFLQYVLSFVVLIGILVFVHEMGHFLAARWNGIRADVFAIGMGPRLFGWNKITGFTFGKLPADLQLEDKTDYRISAFPIGGYVKIAGMVDESMDTDFATKPPEPWEFRSKNTLQKAIVISAGVIMNVILAIVVLGGLNYFQGKELLSTTEIGPLPKGGAAMTAGLMEGDKIVSINGKPINTFDDIRTRIYVDEASNDLKIAATRNGQPITVNIARSAIPSDIEKAGYIIPYPAGTVVLIKNVVDGSPAAEAELMPNDTVVAIDGIHVINDEQFKGYVSGHASQMLTMLVHRSGSTVTKKVRPGENGLIGVEIQTEYTGPKTHVDYSLLGALGSGATESFSALGNIYNHILSLFAGKAKLKDSVGGPMMIAKMARQQLEAGITQFMRLMALLSLMLAFMNILPIPALDGGHLVFILIEGVIRREVPLKIRVAVQQVGFALLLLFMAFVIYNDAARLF